MKKKVIAVVISIIVVIAVAAGIILGRMFLKDKSENFTDLMAENDVDFISLLKQTDITALKEQADLNGIKLTEYKENGYWAVVNCPVYHMTVTSLFYNNGNEIVGNSSKLEFNNKYNKTKEENIPQLQSDIDFSAALCSDIFDADLSECFKIFHDEGYLLDQDMKKACELLLEGKAYAMMLVKIDEQSYWEVKGYMQEEKFVLYFEHIFENLNDEYADIILN